MAESIKLLGEGTFYEMQRYQGKMHNLKMEAVPYVGALRHHYNPNMVLLLVNPLESHSVIFEFRQEDIMHAEGLSGITHPDGVTVETAKIWVRKGAVAMRMEPIRVGEESE